MTPTAFLPAAQGVGDIVGDVERAFVIARVAGIEQMVADLLAVNVELVVAEAADVGARLLDLALQREGAAEQGRGQRIGVRGAADPLRLPILGRQQSHFPTSRRAVGGGAPSLSPARTFQ